MTKTRRPQTVEERLGRAWGVLFVGMVVVLSAVLFAKGCFFSG